MRVIGLLALCVVAVSAIPTDTQRIMGGSLTTIDQYRSIVALLYTSNFANYLLSCGGTLLTNRSVLTAAHCTFRDAPRNWRMRVGSTFAHSGGVTYNAGTIIEHRYFSQASGNNDIAIIRSTTTIDLNGVARAGSIPGPNYNINDNAVVWAAGWGRTSPQGPISEQLRHVQVWTINQAICVQRYSEVRTVITDNMLCSGVLDVGGRDQCAGDSGGPLYHNGVVVGLSSFGISCGSPRFPGVNTRISRYTSWVETNA